MGAFEPLFEIVAQHDYFGAGPCPALDFVPDARSVGLQARAGLLFDRSPGAVGVYYDTGMLDALRLHVSDPQQPLRLVFRARANDATLRAYTDPESVGANAVPYYSSRAATVSGEEATWEKADPVTDEDFERIAKIGGATSDDPASGALNADPRLSELGSVMDPRDRFARPIAVVSVFVLPGQDDRFPPAGPRRYRLGFRALRTIWKYYILGDLAQKEAAFITDVQGEGERAEFERGPKEDLPGNRVALTFQSRTPIPLQRRSERRFQLRENGKVLIKRLPVASPEGYGSVESADGKKTLVSEIYVNG